MQIALSGRENKIDLSSLVELKRKEYEEKNNLIFLWRHLPVGDAYEAVRGLSGNKAVLYLRGSRHYTRAGKTGRTT